MIPNRKIQPFVNVTDNNGHKIANLWGRGKTYYGQLAYNGRILIGRRGKSDSAKRSEFSSADLGSRSYISSYFLQSTLSHL